MEIRDMRSSRKVKFGEIPVGTVIELESGLWIKVDRHILISDIDNSLARELPRNLVRLEDGLSARAASDEFVLPVDLKIEIHDYSPDEGHEQVDDLPREAQK